MKAILHSYCPWTPCRAVTLLTHTFFLGYRGEPILRNLSHTNRVLACTNLQLFTHLRSVSCTIQVYIYIFLFPQVWRTSRTKWIKLLKVPTTATQIHGSTNYISSTRTLTLPMMTAARVKMISSLKLEDSKDWSPQSWTTHGTQTQREVKMLRSCKHAFGITQNLSVSHYLHHFSFGEFHGNDQ